MESWSTVFDDGGKCLYFVNVCDQLVNRCTMLTERNAITIHIAFFTIFKKIIKNKNATTVYKVSFMHYFFFSDDLLEDSDSEEHSRSESVTGMLYLLHVIV